MRSLARSLCSLAAAAALGTGLAAAQTSTSAQTSAPAQTSAAAQTAAPRPTLVPTARSVWFDAGALLNDQLRAGFEGVTLGRYTVGIAVSYTDTEHPRADDVYPMGYAVPQVYTVVRDPIPCSDPRYLALCVSPQPSCGFCGTPAPRYRAWVFDLSARYYPPFLSFRNGPSRMMLYAGGYLGYHWRVSDQQAVYYYPYPVGDGIVRTLMGQDSIIFPPDTVRTVIPIRYPIPAPSAIRRTLSGIQPGLEIGVRLLPVGPLLVEVGGRFTLVTVDDPRQRTRQGDVETRLVIAAGLSW